ncbi:hypothetical protein DFH07DRAFT_798743 [Mycena maculata]|uniref:HMG box domain-containing protein n=1 Tax=Mycena maculata TaxID=230809 RepID=A0AAD7NUJ7_9AGAR|nr:hypothetical protein DFH07DRAFT_798743 [Mycena maculata]
MPAERTRYSRRSQADGEGIVWTLPVEPVEESGIGFVPNLTESTFSDLPPHVDAPDTPISPYPCASPLRRSVHTQKKSETHIPRPPNAFILFRSSLIKSQRVSTEVETNHSTLSKIIGMTWKNLTDEERQVWRQKAMDAFAEHKRNFPTYTFRPKHRGKNVDADGPPPKAKRRVREVYHDPRRCEKIAELLVEGKKGVELDRAIQEFDKHHVPEIVTRFDAPMTARAYRRSSSVPMPNSEESCGFSSSTPPCSAGSSRRRRSSSVGAETRAALEQRPRAASTSSTDVDSASNSDGLLTPPSFDSLSFQSKQEPDLDGFDFSYFSFSNVSSPAPSFGCDPLLPPSLIESSSFGHSKMEPCSPAAYVPAEPMDISAFIANEWLTHGENAFGDYSPVEYAAPLSGFEFPMPTPMYTEPNPKNFCLNFKNLAFDEPCQAFHAQDATVPGLVQLEADLAKLIAQYSL